MLPPETVNPPAGGYAKILDLIQALSQCESCEAFKQKLEQFLETQYGISVRLSEQAGSITRSEKLDLTRMPNTSPEGVMQEHTLLLKSPAGWKLEITLNAEQASPHIAKALLGLIRQHLANLYHQYKVIELLEHTLNSKRPPHAETEAALTVKLNKLTPRERQIVETLMEGLDNAGISSKLGISRRTVEKHLENIFRKLHMENRYQLLTMIRHAPA